MKNKIILLDLNYTLAESVKIDKYFNYYVDYDIYRIDLVEKIKNNRIFLITARTDNYKEKTLEKIKNDTGLNIERTYFKPYNKRFLKVYDFKKMIVEQLFEEGFKPDDFFGIESNINTRNAYKSIGVDSCDYKKFMEKNKCQCKQISLL